MKTKFFTFFLAFLASIETTSASGTLIGDLCYNLDASSHTAEVTKNEDLISRDNYVNIEGAVVIPSSVEYESVTYTVIGVGENAFIDCIGMTSITIPGTVQTIGKWAFSNCAGLTSATLQDGVKSIGVNAFRECTSLVSVNIPQSVTKIESSAFYHCRSLTSVNIPDGITSIGKQTFNGCTNLSTINIPNSVTSIGEYAFGQCGFISMTIPSSVTIIDKAVFWKCASLAEITIHSGITEIKDIAFKECTSLTSIYNYGTNPANAYSSAFDGVNKSTCKLYVPKTSVGLYQNAAVWRDFYNVEAIEDIMAVDETEANGTHGMKIVRDGQVLIERGEKTYTLQGTEVK